MISLAATAPTWPKHSRGVRNCTRRATAARRASWSGPKSTTAPRGGAQNAGSDAKRARLLDRDGTRASLASSSDPRSTTSTARNAGPRARDTHRSSIPTARAPTRRRLRAARIVRVDARGEAVKPRAPSAGAERAPRRSRRHARHATPAPTGSHITRGRDGHGDAGEAVRSLISSPRVVTPPRSTTAPWRREERGIWTRLAHASSFPPALARRDGSNCTSERTCRTGAQNTGTGRDPRALRLDPDGTRAHASPTANCKHCASGREGYGEAGRRCRSPRSSGVGARASASRNSALVASRYGPLRTKAQSTRLPLRLHLLLRHRERPCLGAVSATEPDVIEVLARRGLVLAVIHHFGNAVVRCPQGALYAGYVVSPCPP